MTIKISDLPKEVLEAEYAVRGPIVARAAELEKNGREIIYCNIGNPQALGQTPLSWIRQVLSFVEYPELMKIVPPGKIPADVLETAQKIVSSSKHGLGAYTDSKGFRFVREAIAGFISKRDGIPVDPEAIYLTDGASKGVQAVLKMLLSGDQSGIMIPIPQYPLYSATITLYKGKQIPYYLNEEKGWRLDVSGLEESFAKAKREGIEPRAIVVINPGNPTGAVLDEANISMIIDFAEKHDLSILADEVYQDNIYAAGGKFVSFSKVLERKKNRTTSLFSFHSCSKGFIGECGHRGGFFEYRNVQKDVVDIMTKLQSISLCANSVGQIVTYLLVKPPQKGSPSCELYTKERNEILNRLRRNAEILTEGLNKIDGISCNLVTGAMYAFPKITLPKGRSDFDYCLALLEETGICLVPGSGFGQIPGTAHFRTTILPPTEKIKKVVEQIGRFHGRYK